MQIDWPQVLKFLGPRLGGGVLPGGLVRALTSGATFPSALKAKEHDISFSLPADFSELDDIEELHLSSMGKLLSGEISSVELFDGLTAMNELHVEQTNLEFASWVISCPVDNSLSLAFWDQLDSCSRTPAEFLLGTFAWPLPCGLSTHPIIDPCYWYGGLLARQ